MFQCQVQLAFEMLSSTYTGMILIWRCTPAIVAKCLEPKCNIGTHEHLTHVRHTPSLTKARYVCTHCIHVPRQPKGCTVSIFVWKPVFLQHIHFFIYTGSETKAFFGKLRILSTQGVACLFGHLGRHESREQRKLE